LDSNESKEDKTNNDSENQDKQTLFHIETDKKIKAFKNKHGDEVYFESENPKEIIYYSEHILNLGDKLKYLNYIISDFMDKQFGVCEVGDKIHKTFFLPIWNEIKNTEHALENASNGIRFQEDIFFFDVIELLANNKKNLKERLKLLFSIKEDLKNVYNIYSTIPATKIKLKSIINSVDELMIEVEKDLNRINISDINNIDEPKDAEDHYIKKQQINKNISGLMLMAVEEALKNKKNLMDTFADYSIKYLIKFKGEFVEVTPKQLNKSYESARYNLKEKLIQLFSQYAPEEKEKLLKKGGNIGGNKG